MIVFDMSNDHNAKFPLPIRLTLLSPIKQSGTGLARSVCVIGSGREGLPWSASLGPPTQIFLTCKNNRVGSSRQAHVEALEERSCICRVEDRVDGEAFV